MLFTAAWGAVFNQKNNTFAIKIKVKQLVLFSTKTTLTD